MNELMTSAVRLHGANDIRLERFPLPEPGDDEALLKVITDSLCASTYKAVIQGKNHKRVPDDVDVNPVMVGHELCGELIKVGKNLEGKFFPGEKVIIQPALKLENGHDPGYSYKYVGGATEYAIVPSIVIERGCLLPFSGEGWYKGSLVEAIGCVLRGFKGFYHTDYTDYKRTDGAKKGGKLAVLGGAGPMGLAAAALAIGYAGCAEVTVVDIDHDRLALAEKKLSPEFAEKHGVRLEYVDSSGFTDPAKYLRELSGGGYDDIFVMVPVGTLFTLAGDIAAEDGCVNFFAGPADHSLRGGINLYRVHYDGIHIVGTAGSIPEDTVDTIKLIESGAIDPSIMVSHILGLNDYRETIMAMAHPNGAKKVCYTHLDIPLTALEDFAEKGKTDPMFKVLAEITEAHGGLWCGEAENYLLEHARRLDQ